MGHRVILSLVGARASMPRPPKDEGPSQTKSDECAPMPRPAQKSKSARRREAKNNAPTSSDDEPVLTPAAPAQAQPAACTELNRTLRCSWCNRIGHSKWDCSRNNVPTSSDDEEPVLTPARVCSWCDSSEHNNLNCSERARAIEI